MHCCESGLFQSNDKNGGNKGNRNECSHSSRRQCRLLYIYTNIYMNWILCKWLTLSILQTFVVVAFFRFERALIIIRSKILWIKHAFMSQPYNWIYAKTNWRNAVRRVTGARFLSRNFRFAFIKISNERSTEREREKKCHAFVIFAYIIFGWFDGCQLDEFNYIWCERKQNASTLNFKFIKFRFTRKFQHIRISASHCFWTELFTVRQYEYIYIW